MQSPFIYAVFIGLIWAPEALLAAPLTAADPSSVDFPSIGNGTIAGPATNPTVDANTANPAALPTLIGPVLPTPKPAPAAPASSSDVVTVPIKTPTVDSIPSPVIPPLPEIASPKIPELPEIKTPEIAISTQFKPVLVPDFPEIGSPTGSFTASAQPSIATPPTLNITPGGAPTTFEPTEAGNTAPAPLSAVSTPTLSPQTLPSFGLASTPVQVVVPLPTTTSPVFGQATTPIASPQNVPIFGIASTPVQVGVTSPTFGQPSTPISVGQTSPIFGLASTPISSPVAPHIQGTPLTFQGAPSTPRGLASSPHNTTYLGTPSSPQSSPVFGTPSTPRGGVR